MNKNIKPKCSECKIATAKENCHSEILDPKTAMVTIKYYCGRCWKKKAKK